MSDLDREVGGLRCREVLAILAEYVDDELDGGLKKQVESHLVGCDRCEKFGGEYRSLVASLRRALRREASSEVRSRLEARMKEEWAEPGGEITSELP